MAGCERRVTGREAGSRLLRGRCLSWRAGGCGSGGRSQGCFGARASVRRLRHAVTDRVRLDVDGEVASVAERTGSLAEDIVVLIGGPGR